MKKTCHIAKVFYYCLIVMCLFLFNTSCGLDVLEVIPPPTSVIHYPDYNTEDFEQKYFEFWTYEKFTLATYSFLGTDVYYKIYNDYSRMLSERASLQTLATSETSTNSFSTMTNSTYAYQKIYRESSDAVLIPATGSNQQVYIRLTNYQDDSKYSAQIIVGDRENAESSKNLGVPMRTTSTAKVFTFDFGRDGENDAVPESGDIDVKYTSSSSSTSDENVWYVQLFAVGVARTPTFEMEHSNILFLGAITIDANSEDN